MKIQRFMLPQIREALIPGKVLVLYDLRQVGKTTLVKDLLSSFPSRSRFINADELIYGFSRNLRKEVTKNSHYYFYDNGVRNSLIQNFNPLTLRNDVGQLWENFLFIERRKANQAAGRAVNTYFWRTYDQKEIDCIEEHGGKLYGYEFKWQSSDILSATRNEFLNAYPGSELMAINHEDFESFVL
jgi:predicted AAA+ superfamily ATPase